MFLHIEKVQYIKDYKLKLAFDNGVIKEVELKRFGQIGKGKHMARKQLIGGGILHTIGNAEKI